MCQLCSLFQRSSFSKFDALSRKSGVLHVRSSDAAKAQQHFSQVHTTSLTTLTKRTFFSPAKPYSNMEVLIGHNFVIGGR